MSNKIIYILIFLFIPIFYVFPQQYGIRIVKENNQMSNNIANDEIQKNILEGYKNGLTSDDKKRIETAIQMQVKAKRMKKIEEENYNAYMKQQANETLLETKRKTEIEEATALGKQAATEKAKQLSPTIEKIQQEIENRGDLSLHKDKVNVKKILKRQRGNINPQPIYIHKNNNTDKSQITTTSPKSLSELLNEANGEENKKIMTEEEYKKWLIKNVPEYKQLMEEESELENLIKELNQ